MDVAKLTQEALVNEPVAVQTYQPHLLQRLLHEQELQEEGMAEVAPLGPYAASMPRPERHRRHESGRGHVAEMPQRLPDSWLAMIESSRPVLVVG